MKTSRHTAVFLSVLMIVSVFSCLSVSAVNLDSRSASLDAYIESLDLDVDSSEVMVADDYLYYVTDEGDNNHEVTFILSYVEDEDGLHRTLPGDSVSAGSEYSTQSTYQQPVTFPSYTAYVTIGYTKYTGNYSPYIYKPYSVSGYWKSSTVTESKYFLINYASYGQLCAYPTCLEPSTYSDMAATIVTENYSTAIEVSSSSLAPNYTIIKNQSLPANRAIWFENGILHGSAINVTIGSYSDTVSLGYNY